VDPKTEEFVRLIGAAHWTQAEAARRLQMTPGAVSQICSGRTRPRASTLNLLKMIMGAEHPEILSQHERNRATGLAPWESELLDSLRRLPEAKRERLLPAFKELIKAMGTDLRRKGP
jgi:transcriptional regulator with XRE-family HTH domain